MNRISNIMLIRQDKILLGKRSAHRRLYPSSWALFGGHSEAAETPFETALRELREELNIEATELQFLHQFRIKAPNPAQTQAQNLADDLIMTIYQCSSWTGELHLLGDEHTELGWFEPQIAINLPDLALEEYREIFHQHFSATKKNINSHILQD